VAGRLGIRALRQWYPPDETLGGREPVVLVALLSDAMANRVQNIATANHDDKI
jgi:hypothetical protein